NSRPDPAGVRTGSRGDNAMEDMKGRKLNWKHACDILNCSKSHFYNLVNAGKIPAFRIGKVRAIWVWEKDVRDYMDF
ncbi:helix-turn-helix transcriptional regulator, partial [Desulfobaculum bizertense]|uniref:helix-turn-helix transcriptional regulator n=2 Tax=Desulfobaculum bizertense TaxID=376490 RepID=UPI001F245951